MSVTHVWHLTKRFTGSLSRRPPAPADEAWVATVLGAGEQRVWQRMSVADRRHAVGVAQRVDRALAEGDQAPEPWVLAAALLHDCGKVDSGLGTFGRVGATVWAAVRGHNHASTGSGRIARYLRHDEIGADLLRGAGADERTVAWAAEHHRPPTLWTVPDPFGPLLKAADDD